MGLLYETRQWTAAVGSWGANLGQGEHTKYMCMNPEP